MPRGRPQRIPKQRVCAALDRDSDDYDYWARKGVLQQPPRGQGLSVQEALRFAVVAALRDAKISFQVVRGAWPDLEKQMQDSLLTGQVRLVVNKAQGTARLALNLDDVVEIGGAAGSVKVAQATEHVLKVRRLFRARADFAEQGSAPGSRKATR